ncbi:PTS system mannose/fructose/sorbose family transporter subunit IID [Desulfonatronospira sp.]|uniref:PTS system mannose/fructose/sorbose family transporter subunit IID n=1 Tax=Desulfonatronospira sp. TaxID=1962951 RepID=UPI0025C174E2|nr:PTS system mannose/fructose/sorbose family transporter subunit IID [Desulfonatronospira sp.]
MAHLNYKSLTSCLLRSQLVGCAFNTRGLQNIGLAYALEPGLQKIYSHDPQGLQRARRRHLKFYNTHPFWNPLLVGIFLSLESKISRDLFPSASLPGVKSTLVYTLSAIGDSFFSGSLLVTWALLTMVMVMAGFFWPAILLGIIFFVGLQLFKMYIFYQGYMQGIVFVQRLRRWNLINWGTRLKIVNALLVLCFWLVIWPFQWHTLYFIGVCIVGLIMAWTFRRIQWSREIFLAVVFLLSLLLPWEQMGNNFVF